MISFVAHFVIVKFADDAKSFLVVNDIKTLAGQNSYRYLKHAAIFGSQISFISEHGKDKNKLVILNFN